MAVKHSGVGGFCHWQVLSAHGHLTLLSLLDTRRLTLPFSCSLFHPAHEQYPFDSVADLGRTTGQMQWHWDFCSHDGEQGDVNPLCVVFGAICSWDIQNIYGFESGDG